MAIKMQVCVGDRLRKINDALVRDCGFDEICDQLADLKEDPGEWPVTLEFEQKIVILAADEVKRTRKCCFPFS